jgi:secreted PhoX family phosphatase
MIKIDNEDKGTNVSGNETFQDVLDARLSRRGFVGGGLAAAAGLTLGGVSALMKSVPLSAQDRKRPLLGFKGIEVSTADTVAVPRGYTAEVLIAWGDPVAGGPEFEQDASNSAADQAQQWGAHNDGLVYFPIDGSRTACSQRTTSTLTKACSSPTASSTGMKKRPTSHSTPTACRSSRSRESRITTVSLVKAGAASGPRRTANGGSCADRSTRAGSPVRLR